VPRDATAGSLESQHRDQRDAVRRDVEPVDGLDREAGEQEAGDRRSDDLARAEQRLPQRVGADDGLTVDDVDDECRTRGAVDSLERGRNRATDKEGQSAACDAPELSARPTLVAPSRIWVRISSRRRS